MSLQFNDTTNKSGIIQRIEQELGFPDGYISGDTTRLKQWTASVNLSLDAALAIIYTADGRWNFDDGNHTTYPILTGNFMAGQRDYSYVADSDGNLTLDLERVFVRKSTTDPYVEIFPVDVQSDPAGVIGGLADGMNVTGWPSRYDKTGTGIFFEKIPPEDVTGGFKLYVSREGSYFTTSDTTKKPGFDGLCHEFLVLDSVYRFSRGGTHAKTETFKRDLAEETAKLKKRYSRRAKDEENFVSGEQINSI